METLWTLKDVAKYLNVAYDVASRYANIQELMTYYNASAEDLAKLL